MALLYNDAKSQDADINSCNRDVFNGAILTLNPLKAFNDFPLSREVLARRVLLTCQPAPLMPVEQSRKVA